MNPLIRMSPQDFTTVELADSYDFPQEICDKIAGYIKDDGVCLRSLRLVSKTWKSAANRHAFVSNVRSTIGMSDADLLHFVIEFPQLHTLRPVGRELTAHGLAKACAPLNRLYSVDLRACPQVTATFLGKIVDLPNIRWVAKH